MSSKPITGYVNPNSKKTIVKFPIEPPIHVVVLVPGTTDPVNTHNAWENYKDSLTYADELEYIDIHDPSVSDAKKTQWNEINTFANETYWASYPNFLPSVDDFVEELHQLSYCPVHLIKKVRWSGDNNDDERKKAGKIVADLLLEGGPKNEWISDADKEELKKKKVWIHLIGHSHGGNVMNEFTQAFSQHSERPKNWQVKTLVYLSTPFFNDMHHVNGQALHPDCKIINVYNEFDLTQRTIADYTVKSMDHLELVLNEFKDLSNTFSKIDIERIKPDSFPFNSDYDDGDWDEDSQSWEEAYWVTDKDSKNGKWDGPSGPGVWRYLLSFFEKKGLIDKAIRNFIKSIDTWNKDPLIPLFNESTTEPLSNLTAFLEKWRESCQASLFGRLKSKPDVNFWDNTKLALGAYFGKNDLGDYADYFHRLNHFSVLWLIVDLNIHDLIYGMAEAMGFEEGGFFKSHAYDFIDQLLLNILKEFDDTMPKPTTMDGRSVLPKAFQEKVNSFSVKRHDLYKSYTGSQYQQFIDSIEDIQTQYALESDSHSNKAKSLRKEYLLKLAANALPYQLLDLGFGFEVLIELAIEFLGKFELPSEREKFDDRAEYLDELKDKLADLHEDNCLKLIYPPDWLYQQALMLINEDKNANAHQLEELIDTLIDDREFTRFYSVWRNSSRKSLYQKPNQSHIDSLGSPYEVQRYLIEHQDKQNARANLLTNMLKHWPEDWGFPIETKIPDETGALVGTIEGHNIRGSINYLAIRSHSVSREKIYYNPEIRLNIINSCLAIG